MSLRIQAEKVMTNALNRFGTFCREARAKQELTMAAQAEALGHDVVDISAIESGKVIPTGQYVQQFCEWLKIPSAKRAEFEKRVPQNATIIAFPRRKDGSSTVRMFRKVSKMSPAEIRKLGKGHKNG